MKRIAILGPESTGKTALAQSLASYYNSPWIPEYARQYVEQLDRPYTYEDVENIARHQIAEVSEYETKFREKKILFLDTELIITKIWFLHVYQKCPDFLLTALQESSVDLYLLCQPDIPWEYDPVRENGNLRDYFYEWYKKEIIALNKPFVEINGLGDVRLQNAIQSIDALNL